MSYGTYRTIEFEKPDRGHPGRMLYRRRHRARLRRTQSFIRCNRPRKTAQILSHRLSQPSLHYRVLMRTIEGTRRRNRTKGANRDARGAHTLRDRWCMARPFFHRLVMWRPCLREGLYPYEVLVVVHGAPLFFRALSHFWLKRLRSGWGRTPLEPTRDVRRE